MTVTDRAPGPSVLRSTGVMAVGTIASRGTGFLRTLVLLAAMAGGWGGQKLRANAEAIAWLPRLLRERRAITHERTISAREFADALTPDLDSPFIPAVVRSGPARLR